MPLGMKLDFGIVTVRRPGFEWQIDVRSTIPISRFVGSGYAKDAGKTRKNVKRV
jgi:hypothetical protein